MLNMIKWWRYILNIDIKMNQNGHRVGILFKYNVKIPKKSLLVYLIIGFNFSYRRVRRSGGADVIIKLASWLAKISRFTVNGYIRITRNAVFGIFGECLSSVQSLAIRCIHSIIFKRYHSTFGE